MAIAAIRALARLCMPAPRARGGTTSGCRPRHPCITRANVARTARAPCRRAKAARLARAPVPADLHAGLRRGGGDELERARRAVGREDPLATTEHDGLDHQVQL